MPNVYVKNGKAGLVLMAFIEYCNENPSLRFWQALCNWSHTYILSYKGEVVSELINQHHLLEDTYYWEGIDK